MATEVLFADLKPGSDISVSSSSNEAKTLAETIETVSAQPGMRAAWWGTVEGQPGRLVVLIDWDSIESHVAFTKQEHYKPFFERFSSLLEQRPSVFHIKSGGLQNKGAVGDTVAPVTEFMFAHLPADYSQEEQDRATESNIKGLHELVEKAKGHGATGIAGGWSFEDTVPHEESGKNTRCYLALIGWDKIDSHKEFQKTDTYKSAVQSLSDPRSIGRSVLYASLKEVQGGGSAGSVRGNAPI